MYIYSHSSEMSFYLLHMYMVLRVDYSALCLVCLYIRTLQCEHFSMEALLCGGCSALSTSEYMLYGQKALSHPIQTLGWIRLNASYPIIMTKICLALLYSED